MKTIVLTEVQANWLSYLLSIPSQHLFAFNPDEPILETLEVIVQQLKDDSNYLTTKEKALLRNLLSDLTYTEEITLDSNLDQTEVLKLLTKLAKRNGIKL